MKIDSWNQSFVKDDNLRVGHGRITAVFHEEFSNASCSGLNSFITLTELPADIRTDLFIYHSKDRNSLFLISIVSPPRWSKSVEEKAWWEMR